MLSPQKMPKELISAGWVQKPCSFFLPESSPGADSCAQCEGTFGWWKNGRSYCLFCGYFFHRNNCCSRKLQVEGEFFKQRICSRCHYYKTTAGEKLRAGEEFECIGSEADGGGVCVINVSLNEETAQLLLHWKEKGLRETADLTAVEIRKGFSHLHRDLHSAAGDYEPLKSFSLFIEDSLGGQRAYLLKATSALTCQLWVEGLKAAGYVYQRMLEQARAMESHSKAEMTQRGKQRHRKLYLPTTLGEVTSDPSPLAVPSSDADLEEWEDIVLPVLPSPSSLYTQNSSGYQSDLSLSLCSSIIPTRQSLTVHSLNLPSAHSPPWNDGQLSSACSLPPTPGLPSSRKHSATFSLPPTPGKGTFTLPCPCHYRSQHAPKNMPMPTKCCEECQSSCKIALELHNF